MTKEEDGRKKLKNAKHELFCQELTLDENQTKAAIRAGYEEKSAESQSSRLLTNDKVKARVSYLRAQVADKLGIKAEHLVSQLNNLRKARISDYVELITSEETTVTKDGIISTGRVQRLVWKDFKDLTEDQILRIEGVKDTKNGIELKLHGIEWSIEKLSKYVGLYEKDNKQGKSTVTIYKLPDNGRGSNN